MKSGSLSPYGLPLFASGSLKACGRAAVAAMLCVLLAEQPLLAEAAAKKTVPAAPAEMPACGHPANHADDGYPAGRVIVYSAR